MKGLHVFVCQYLAHCSAVQMGLVCISWWGVCKQCPPQGHGGNAGPMMGTMKAESTEVKHKKNNWHTRIKWRKNVYVRGNVLDFEMGFDFFFYQLAKAIINIWFKTGCIYISSLHLSKYYSLIHFFPLEKCLYSLKVEFILNPTPLGSCYCKSSSQLLDLFWY